MLLALLACFPTPYFQLVYNTACAGLSSTTVLTNRKRMRRKSSSAHPMALNGALSSSRRTVVSNSSVDRHEELSISVPDGTSDNVNP